jgi:ABC-type Fe3+/spermidine/putrescine transport system ATPase subunit
VFARPERLHLVDEDVAAVRGVVKDVVFVGSTSHIRVALDDDRELQVVVPNDGDTRVPVPGVRVGVAIPSDAIRVL